MAENLFEAQYDVTKKSRLKKFYDSYKIEQYLLFCLHDRTLSRNSHNQ